MLSPRRARRAALLALGLVALAMILVPVLLIRPFSPQTPTPMAIAFALRRWAPLATLFAAALALVLAKQLRARFKAGR